jgi:glycosyltransferase involved in cell wall biosynthesis
LVAVGQAFLKAFPVETDVRLNYKVHPDCDFERIAGDDRVQYCAEFVDWPTMVKLYRMNTAYVSGSRGEGWGLHLIQSMSVGCCPIAARFGGQSEFFDSSVGRPVRYKQVRATGDYAGMGSWAEIDEDSLIQEMRWVYENKLAARKLGKLAAKRASEYTWNRTVFELMKVLQEFSVL